MASVAERGGVHAVEADVILPSGQRDRLCLKAWVANGRVLWETRRFVLLQLQDEYTKAFDLSSWLSHNREALAAWVSKFGLSLPEHLFPSRLAYRRSGADNEPMHCKSEYSMTTAALILLLLWFRISKKKHAQRSRASCILVALLCAILPPGWVWVEDKSQMLGEFAELCCLHDGGHDYCKHVADHNRLTAALPPGTPQQSLVEYLQLLAESVGCECLALGALRTDFVMEVVAKVDDVIENRGFGVDPSSLQPLPAGPSGTVRESTAEWVLS